MLYKYVGNGIVYPWVSDDEQAHDVEMTFNDVDERLLRRIDVSATLFQRCVPVGLLNLPLRSKEQNEKVTQRVTRLSRAQTETPRNLAKFNTGFLQCPSHKYSCQYEAIVCA